jgi:type VI secretion system secreted protein Hcp
MVTMAVRYFLKIQGVEGESQDERHRNEIEVEAWTWSEAQVGGGGGGGGGGGAGRVQLGDLQFTARTGRASPKLFLACAAGQHVPQAVLVAQRTGKAPLDFLAITLDDVTVTAYEAGDAGTTQDAPRDRVSLGFERIQVEYRPQQPDGSAGAPVRAGWNVQANRPA